MAPAGPALGPGLAPGQGDEVLPSAVVVDSRSLRSAPTAWTRGIDGGKLIKGVKLLVICDKHGSLLDLELQPANMDDRAGTLPMLPRLTALGFQGDLLGDSGFKGAPFAAAALAHDIHVSASPGGTRDGRFLPSGIRWVVERLLAWSSRYRRLNVVFDREPDLFAAHVWIALISIISRRLVAHSRRSKRFNRVQLLRATRFGARAANIIRVRLKPVSPSCRLTLPTVIKSTKLVAKWLRTDSRRAQKRRGHCREVCMRARMRTCPAATR